VKIPITLCSKKAHSGIYLVSSKLIATLLSTTIAGETTLFVPRLDEAYKMWMYVKPVEQFKKEVRAREVLFTDELEKFI
jgi:hypothetical protein